MTTTGISTFLLALLLVASCATAATIEALCKGTYDPKICVAMFQKVGSPSTDFKPEELRKMLLDQVQSKGLVAQNFLADGLTKLKGAEAASLKKCDENIRFGVQQISKGEYDNADFAFDNCYDNLDAGGDAPKDSSDTLRDIMIRVRALADEAATACKIAIDFIIHLKEQNPKRKA